MMYEKAERSLEFDFLSSDLDLRKERGGGKWSDQWTYLVHKQCERESVCVIVQ